MDEQLINEYINNLANQVNNLTQENILLKTRLSLLEKREQERLAAEEKKEVPTHPAPKSEYSTPPEEQPQPQVEQLVPKEPDFVKGPKAFGYNPKVEGPIPLIPNPKIAEE